MLRVAPLSRLAFAASGVPTAGIVSNGIDYFLFFFYSQLLGLSASLTGLALAIALACDAVSDPIIGYLSDNLKSRWGRRHPFMYASIVPISALYVLIWFPPADASSQGVLFGYLLAVAVLLRLSMTLFDMPVQTLVAELTFDYDERTDLASLPITVSWITSSVMTIAMYAYWLRNSAEHINGQLNIAGYQQAALVSGVVVLVSLIFSSVGLHPEIPRLPTRTAEQAASFKDMFLAFAQLLRNRSMRALLAASLFLAAALGVDASLWLYQYSAFYGMSSNQMLMLTVMQLVATFAVMPIVRNYVVKGDKKVMAIRFLVASVAISVILPPLHVLKLLPGSGSNGLMGMLMVYDFLSQLIWVVVTAIIYSMYADVTEEMLLAVGKRMEGALFACQTFVSKGAGAIGALLAGALLTLIHYPVSGDGARVSDKILARLGISYMASWLVLASIGIWLISQYRITRASHAAEVETLVG
jgi:GPH family glycoside/pentoside/hexuronide:cation symporter